MNEPSLTKDTFESTESLVAKLDYLDQIGMQLTPGAHRIEYNTIFYEDCFLMKLNMKNSTLFEGICDENYIYISVPSKHQFINVNGYNLSFQELYVMAPTREIKAVFPDEFQGYYIGISKQNLELVIGKSAVKNILEKRESIFSGRIRFIDIEGFKYQFIKNIELLTANFDKLNDVAKLDVKDNIIASLCSLKHAKINGEIKNQKYNNSLAVVQRATDYLAQNPNNYISVISLCEKVFCSLRTLEYAFNKIYGLPPKKYLILRRMHFIKNSLKNSPQVSLTSILQNNGIVNLGRFRQDYYQMFGEYPKETLLKSR